MLSTKSKKSFTGLLLVLLLMAGGVVIYTFFDPTQYVWMPKCPFHLLTGWNCPSCGVQRAMHALLHGHFSEAVSYNYFFVVCVPYIIALLAAEVLKWLHRGDEFIRAVQHPVIARVYIVMFFLWWFIRNLLQV